MIRGDFRFPRKVFAKIFQIKANLKKISVILTLKKPAEVPVLLFLQKYIFSTNFATTENFAKNRQNRLFGFIDLKENKILKLAVNFNFKLVLKGHTCTELYEFKMAMSLCVSKRDAACFRV